MKNVWIRQTRRKAVWGPKRTLAVLAVLCVTGLVTTPAEAKPKHDHQPGTKTAGMPGGFVKNYKLDDTLTEHANQGNGLLTTRVIVQLNPGATLPPEFKKFARNRRLDLLNGEVLEVPNGILKQMAAHPSIFQVHYDRPIGAHNYRTSVTVGARTVQNYMGLTGTGVGIAIIDSGITAWHDDLTNKTSKLFPYGNQRVAKFVDFVNGRSLPYDDNGHGSHVAGIIAGNGYDSYGEKTGIAPDANIVSLKVLDQDGKGTISNIIAALSWIATNGAAYNIRVVNMSVGAGIYESYWTDPLTLATKKLTDKGIVVVAAAGNFGKNTDGHLQYGGITAPGNAPWVLTVGASTTNGTLSRSDDEMAGFSSSGPSAIDYEAKPDLVAPGVGTVSLAVPGSTFYMLKSQYLLNGLRLLGSKPYLALSGTSMAAPVVSGSVALMLQVNPKLTPNLVKAILQYTAQQYPGYSPLRQGAGFLNTLGAVRLAQYYLNPRPGDRVPTQTVWSRQILWGSHRVTGGIMKPSANAWSNTVVWGSAKTMADSGDNIVWGSMALDGDNIVWGSADSGDNIVWGTAWVGDNIVWGTSDGGDNIVWGSDCGGADCDNTVWGTSDGDNIVWGTCDGGDNIVWGSALGDNIVWGTSADADVTWGSSDTEEAQVFNDDATGPVPDPQLEFGDTVPLVPDVTVNPVTPVVGSLGSIGGF
ncbi:MAG TPA: S8 family peptidase [Vicinamibacterales bacterium]|nr:S8 family peptidase [Vicinamibacterales bacterium]